MLIIIEQKLLCIEMTDIVFGYKLLAVLTYTGQNKRLKHWVTNLLWDLGFAPILYNIQHTLYLPSFDMQGMLGS